MINIYILIKSTLFFSTGTHKGVEVGTEILIENNVCLDTTNTKERNHNTNSDGATFNSFNQSTGFVKLLKRVALNTKIETKHLFS